MSDRKYKQSGYQDDGQSRARKPGGPRPRKEGPRGRGLGAPTETVSNCARCGAKVPAVRGVEDVCSACGNDIHTCTNCRHFDPSAPMECRVEIEERIASKAKRNTCSLFAAKEVKEFARDGGSSGGSSDPKAAFDDLFNF